MRTPLIGQYFNPPSKELTDGLPPGFPLILEFDRENPRDKDAITVSLDPAAIPEDLYESLDLLIRGSGCNIEMLLNWNGPFLLGVVPASKGPICTKVGCPGNLEAKAMMEAGPVEVTLVFSEDNSPWVNIKPAEGDGAANPQDQTQRQRFRGPFNVNTDTRQVLKRWLERRKSQDV